MSDSDNVGQPPQSVLLNPQTDGHLGSQEEHQEQVAAQQSVVFIRAPKFKHPSRLVRLLCSDNSACNIPVFLCISLRKI